MARKPPGWHREDIKSELRKQFGSLRALGRRWGYSSNIITSCLARPTSTLVERRIAEALGVTPFTLWPDRWTPEGVAKRRVYGPQATGRAPAQTSQNKEAA